MYWIVVWLQTVTNWIPLLSPSPMVAALFVRGYSKNMAAKHSESFLFIFFSLLYNNEDIIMYISLISASKSLDLKVIQYNLWTYCWTVSVIISSWRYFHHFDLLSSASVIILLYLAVQRSKYDLWPVTLSSLNKHTFWSSRHVQHFSVLLSVMFIHSLWTSQSD